ncbi:probable G-protein coupled receptor 139 [Hypanus sabinus]|uniref:probable G-protein coupled receptor 139 n=1 Tax=Hypanus sabinus TaxID=79690 RepID=UPI0028C4CCC5|nr:probable G-protein coupled receptor 139 [Hypanus sabinus]
MHTPPRDLVYAIYYTVLAVIAVPVNVVAIVILSRGKCGLSRCISRYLVSMAATDLLVIITAVILNRIPAIYFPGSSLSITPVCSFSITLIYVARDSSVWLTVMFTFDRYVAICWQKLKAKYCTHRTAGIVVSVVCTLGFVINIPCFFLYEPMYVIDNVPWYCKRRDIISSSLLWIIFDWTDRAMTPCLPFLFILSLNALTVRYILAASRARRRLRSCPTGEKQSDPEMESRRKSIVLLFAISGCFILLWMPYVVNFLVMQLQVGYKINGYSDPRFILMESGNVFQLLSCCTNTFIYVVTQKKFRNELKLLMKFPLNISHSIAPSRK